MAVKAVQLEACVAFDTTRTHEVLRRDTRGAIKVCHGGLVEWVVPYVRRGQIQWVLFAGQRTAGASLRATYRHGSEPKTLAYSGSSPPLVEDEDAAYLLESLRQLNARLQAWCEELERSPLFLAARDGGDGIMTRREAIMKFIEYRHRTSVKLRDLAEYLHISETRAGHAAREA